MGYLWVTEELRFSERLGWAITDEKGICVRLQRFTQGVIIFSDTAEICANSGPNKNQASGEGFPPIQKVLYNNKEEK